ncbi:MAG TPA: 3-dehydroquinate synthase [Arenimonas sp.]|nr:3-dehydroquinate synthase [Arenimonas sp.]
MRTLTVELGARRYPIRIGAGLLGAGDALEGLLPGRHVLLVSDANVATHYLAPLQALLADKTVRTCVLTPGEQEKNLERYGELLQALAELGASRDATVIALGGGVVGDLAGFVAASWMRGVRFVQCPTTLLAMVDSSVGGKTAVDLPQGKNLVGAFHQPAAVLADTATLATLPERELRAGLAEVVKYGAIIDAGFFDWIEDYAEALLGRDAAALEEAIARSCAIKAGIVARDETEQGERMLLNFGHSFGHAIEAEQSFGGLNHGEAVAVGMVLAARLSVRLGMADAGDGARLQALLQRLGLPDAIPEGLPMSGLIARMRLDKKNQSGRLRLILWRGIGRAEVVADVPEAEILALETAPAS